MAERYDVVVIGAGHNGLTCACYLARAGLRVLVLEQYDAIGGMTITAEITGPGLLSDIHASGYLSAKLSPAPDELALAQHGLALITPEPNWAHVFPDGRSVLISRDLDRTVESLARLAPRDAATWRALVERYRAARPRIVAGYNAAPPSVADEAAALAHASDGLAAYRFGLQSVRAWAGETFEREEAAAVCATFALHASSAPDEAGSAETAWLFTSVVQDAGVSLVRGGMHHVPLALAADLAAHGGVVRTGARVAEIETDDGRATRVRLDSGEAIIVGRVVASNVDPLHLVADLLGEAALGPTLVDRVRQYEWGDPFFTIYVALDAPVSYRAGPEVSRAGYVHAITPSMEALSRIFTECRSGLLPSEPMVGIINESAVDPTRAPAGTHLMKFVVHFAPYEVRGDATGRIRGTSWDEVRDAYADYVLGLLAERYLPGLTDHIVTRVARSPVDLERHLSSAVHGTHQHGAPVLYQKGAMRPLPELGQYRTPVPNVYLCGAGSHPGPGVSFAPGRNAARAILHDLGITFPGAA